MARLRFREANPLIARVTGIIETVENGVVVIALPESGIALETLVPTTLAEDLADRIGESATLHTQLLFEAHGQGASMTPRLLGFGSASDRRFFQLFTSVKGLGPRKALRALAAPVPVIARSISESDAKSLQRLPEIGKKLAETIIHELRDKVGAYAAAGATVEGKGDAARANSAAAEQTIEALVRLGETRVEAERMVADALSHDPSLETADALLAAAFGMRRD